MAKTKIKMCDECGYELCGPCRNCECYGCDCGGHENIMCFASSDAIHRDWHFRADAMGYWYCDICSVRYEMNWDDQYCNRCNSRQMAGGPCGDCDKQFCLDCDGGEFADGTHTTHDFPDGTLGKFYCGDCIKQYER